MHKTEKLHGQDDRFASQAVASECRGVEDVALRQMQAQILQQLAGVSQRKDKQHQREVNVDLRRVLDTSFQSSGASEALFSAPRAAEKKKQKLAS